MTAPTPGATWRCASASRPAMSSGWSGASELPSAATGRPAACRLPSSAPWTRWAWRAAGTYR
eukprot:1961499-Alexandrium_andersonii.AAC.1